MLLRNQEKKVKKARHEAEKSYIGALASLGNETGEYVGDGQGEAAADETVADILVDHSPDFDVDNTPIADEPGVSDKAEPLLIFYDCEATGLSIYQEHVIEIAAEVLECPFPYDETIFSSLIKTARRIQSKGTLIPMNVQ